MLHSGSQHKPLLTSFSGEVLVRNLQARWFSCSPNANTHKNSNDNNRNSQKAPYNYHCNHPRLPVLSLSRRNGSRLPDFKFGLVDPICNIIRLQFPYSRAEREMDSCENATSRAIVYNGADSSVSPPCCLQRRCISTSCSSSLVESVRKLKTKKKKRKKWGVSGGGGGGGLGSYFGLTISNWRCRKIQICLEVIDQHFSCSCADCSRG